MATDTDIDRRHIVEKAFHDRMAQGDFSRFPYNLGILELADRYAFSRLGDLRGKIVVDYGCGGGANAIRLAQQGAEVWAFDISEGMLDVARQHAAQNGVGDRIRFEQMPGEKLKYPNDSVDCVFGHSILHHLNLDHACAEIRRVLKPGGRAVFLEPLGHSPLINLFRELTPNRRTPTEVPLSVKDLERLGRSFSDFAHREFLFLGLGVLILGWLGRAVFQAVFRVVSAVDDFIIGHVRFVRRYCWVTVLEMVK